MINTNTAIRIIINGAFGKMGIIASEFLNQEDNFIVIDRLGRGDRLAEVLVHKKPDLVIDLTRADCVYQNCQSYLDTKTRFVIGASGLSPTQILELKEACQQKNLGGIIVPNFSIGSVLCTYFAKIAAPWFDGVDIIEMHHQQKADSPSGTAIYTAAEIHQAKSEWPMMNSTPQPGREHFVHQVPIHSVRMPGLLAVQQTLFGQIGETISLNHQIIDRKAYMPGLRLACTKVITIEELKIGLEHWLL